MTEVERLRPEVHDGHVVTERSGRFGCFRTNSCILIILPSLISHNAIKLPKDVILCALRS